jgi:cell division protein FtsB
MAWRILFLFLCIVNALLIYTLIWGEHGVLRYVSLTEYNKELEQEVAAVKDRNVELSRRIRMLKNDSAYQKKVIRTEMRFVRSNEILYLMDGNAHQSIPDGPEE